MSWLFGIIGPHVRNGDLQRYRSVHDTQIHENIKEGSHYFAGGGNIQTCFAGNTTFDDSFWMGLGIIIQNKDAGCKIFSSEEWAGIARNTEMLNSQNGHYIFLTYADNAFTIRTDTLGLRTIYWDQRENEIVVSTRIDWIAKYRGGLIIDYRNTGSRWLLFNQLSYRSLVKETNRLGPNGTLIIRNNRVTFSGNPFTPPPIFEQRFNRRWDRMSSSVCSAVVTWTADIAGIVRRA